MVEECSFGVTQEGNAAKKEGNFDRALELYLRCPERNFPNLVGLAEVYEPTRTALHELEQKLKAVITPPALSDELNLLLRIEVFLNEKVDVIALHKEYLEGDLSGSEMASTFAMPLLRVGAFEEAGVYEEFFRERLRNAVDEIATAECVKGSDEDLIFGGALEDYARLLVGECRSGEAVCLIGFGRERCQPLTQKLSNAECPPESGEVALDCDKWLEEILSEQK